MLLGRCVRFGVVTGRYGGLIYGPHLVKHCQDRYGFIEIPRALTDFDYERGVTFLHGIFHGLVISRFQVFRTGMVAEANAETDFAANFIDDAISSLAASEIVEVDYQGQPKNFYFSELEVTSDVNLENAFKQFDNFGKKISQTISSYGQNVPDFSFGSFGLTTQGNIPWFKFENRINAHPGVYYSAAPLRTQDHLSSLNELENLLAKTNAS